MKINSHNEWDKLQEIIVGNPEAQAGMIYVGSEPLTEEKKRAAEKLARQAYPQWLIDEIGEDLEELCGILRDFGAKVLRPARIPNAFDLFTTPYFTAAMEHCYNMRDLHLVVGNKVIEGPSQERHRYFEAMGLYEIWYEKLKEGFTWISPPKPRLDDRARVPYFENGKKYFKLGEDEFLFEPANTVRMGRDLLYLVSRSGNEIGARWLQQMLGDDYKVHTTSKIYRSSHIDSTVLCLKAGLVLLNANRVNEENCPEVLAKWDKIMFSDIVPTPAETMEFQAKVRHPVHHQLEELGFESSIEFLSSDWIGLNILSLDPQTVVVDKRQVPLIKTLEGRGLTVVPLSFRHSYMMGGIHCSTLDTVRDSKLESYC